MNLEDVVTKNLEVPDMYGLIYLYTCTTTGKHYVGQTIGRQVKSRISKFITGKGYAGKKINNARAKYSTSEWIWGILEILDSKTGTQEKLDELEIKYVAEYDSYYNGYNLTLGGGGRNVDYKNYFSDLIPEVYNSRSEALIDLRTPWRAKTIVTLKKTLPKITRGDKAACYLYQDEAGKLSVDWMFYGEIASKEGITVDTAKKWARLGWNGYCDFKQVDNICIDLINNWLNNDKIN